MTFEILKNSHTYIKKNRLSKNYLVTISIGKKYYNNWKKYSLNSWLSYCKNNNLGILVIHKHLVKKKSNYWKTPTWQRLLVAEYIKKYSLDIKNICVLDNDIFINSLAPNIFKFSNLKKISVVNVYKNLPHHRTDYKLRERIVYLRRLFLDKSFPLRSSITASPKEIFKHYKLGSKLDNYFCGGVMVYDVKRYSNFFKNIYLKYCNKKYQKIFATNKGVDIPLNFEVMNKKKVHWLDYKFQTCWLFELSDKYSFLYRAKKNRSSLIRYCAEEILLNSYFLHFPGTLKDSGLSWKIPKFFKDKQLIKLNYLFNKTKIYLKPKFLKNIN